MSQMLDLHCHILPGVDDGPTDLAEALEVARLSVADGITHVIATPHCHRHIHLLRADILPHVERFAAELAAAAIPLSILPGSEVQLTDPAEYRREFEAGLYCHLGDRSDFTLLEFSWDPLLYPPDAAEVVAWVRDRGTQVIIAHPERYKVFQEGPDRLGPLAAAGAWFQVTVDSLLGNHGSASRALGEEILRAYPDVLLATDAHRPKRCSGLSVGYAWVRDRFGPDRAADLRARADAILARLLAPA
jgi:protein-tyrosine phosphatase